MQKGSISFFIQQNLEPFYIHPVICILKSRIKANLRHTGILRYDCGTHESNVGEIRCSYQQPFTSLHLEKK